MIWIFWTIGGIALFLIIVLIISIKSGTRYGEVLMDCLKAITEILGALA